MRSLRRSFHISLPILAIAGALLWGVIETIALWRARRDNSTLTGTP